jgi:phosphoribosylaminoimidazole-succinocarboxamide synthase
MFDFQNVAWAEINERTKEYVETYIDAHRANTIRRTEIDTTSLPKFMKKNVGKVRDLYICEDLVFLVTTDRQSAFDRQLASVPFKGQILNLISLWWLNLSKDIVPNHVLASPHPNVTIGKKCTVFPIEFVMRGYITGSTSTSLWINYKKGVRFYCGHHFPDGLVKNQKLDSNKLTPTTKSDEHDELISAEEILTKGLMTKTEWDQCAAYAHQLFTLGQVEAAKKGLILVDTKYEFGRDASGNIVVIDEIHTPDSSRYWMQDTYEARMAANEEPDNIDKEFLRKWYISQCDPYTTETLPDAPADLVNELSRR